MTSKQKLKYLDQALFTHESHTLTQKTHVSAKEEKKIQEGRTLKIASKLLGRKHDDAELSALSEASGNVCTFMWVCVMMINKEKAQLNVLQVWN